MNWSDERYVKLYVRNTATWVLWPWQARAVFPSLLRVANGAGIVETGPSGIAALCVLIAMPREVVEPAMAALIADGTVEAIRSGFLMPKFIEAQEATKTDTLRKRDHRMRLRDQARVIIEPPVTQGHSGSPSSPAQPSPPPAQIKEVVELAPANVDPVVAETLVEAWNKLGKPFARVRDVTRKRRVRILARFRDTPDIERWLSVMARIPTTPFLRGENERGWVANFDWLMQPDSLTKIEEGNYERGAGIRGKSAPPARAEDSRAAFEAMAHMTPEEREQAALEAFAS
jgi:hypothetical protein